MRWNWTSIIALLALAMIPVSAATGKNKETAQRVELHGQAVHKAADTESGAAMLCAVRVNTAKAEDGKDVSDLKGKTVTITGAKAAEIEKNNGKNVIAKGALSEDKLSLEAESVAPEPPQEKPKVAPPKGSAPKPDPPAESDQ